MKNCDIDRFLEIFNEGTNYEEKSYHSLDDLYVIFEEFEDVNREILRQLFDKEAFFNEGKKGKLRLLKLLMFALLYYDKKGFESFYELFITNQVIIQEFTNFICKQYFDTHKKYGLTFKEFSNIAQSHQYWFFKPTLIREEFLVYALQNRDRALMIFKSDDEKVFLEDKSSLKMTTQENNPLFKNLMLSNQKINSQYLQNKLSSDIQLQKLVIQLSERTSQHRQIKSNLETFEGKERKIIDHKISTKSLQEEQNSLSEDDKLQDIVSVSQSISNTDSEEEEQKHKDIKDGIKKQKTKLLLGEQDIYELVLCNMEQKYGEIALTLYQKFTKYKLETADLNQIQKLLYRLRVHQCFTTDISSMKDEFVISLQRKIEQNLSKNDVLLLSKSKLINKKFLYVYQEILEKFEEMTNSHFFQIKKQAKYYDCEDLIEGLSLPNKVKFIQQLDDLKNQKINKQEQHMISFTLIMNNNVIMITIYRFKSIIYTFSSIDFSDSENVDQLKKMLFQFIKEKQFRQHLDNGTIKFVHHQLPSNKDFDTLMYFCDVSYCWLLGIEPDLNHTSLTDIKNRILYQISIILTC
ncbi:UNKNOWN [Stylonychia lemnae]|uniref:Uncharacterized protein n=1 Tax=Stylonychia lemnae TaxID=5949 RepID=A0A078AIR7_STYLE|nr:UNKNOWN [Stylonychia lemnae]|eukprot:CDW82114.1 UNKNOWN [Stylonychia lemnae]